MNTGHFLNIQHSYVLCIPDSGVSNRACLSLSKQETPDTFPGLLASGHETDIGSTIHSLMLMATIKSKVSDVKKKGAQRNPS